MSIQEVKDSLLNTFTLFRNCDIYYNYTDFEAGGIDDRKINYFYLRQPISNRNHDQNISYTSDGCFRVTNENWRLVAQLDKRVDPDTALEALKAHLENVVGKRLRSASRDSSKVYAMEHSEKIVKTMTLLMVDFTISHREGVGTCGCIADICPDLCN